MFTQFGGYVSNLMNASILSDPKVESNRFWENFLNCLTILREAFCCALCNKLSVDLWTNCSSDCEHLICRDCTVGQKILKLPCRIVHNFKKANYAKQFLEIYKEICQSIYETTIIYKVLEQKKKIKSNVRLLTKANRKKIMAFINEGRNLKFSESESFEIPSGLLIKIQDSSTDTEDEIDIEDDANEEDDDIEDENNYQIPLTRSHNPNETNGNGYVNDEFSQTQRIDETYKCTTNGSKIMIKRTLGAEPIGTIDRPAQVCKRHRSTFNEPTTTPSCACKLKNSFKNSRLVCRGYRCQCYTNDTACSAKRCSCIGCNNPSGVNPREFNGTDPEIKRESILEGDTHIRILRTICIKKCGESS